MAGPVVSIVIPCFNRAHCVERAIASIVAEQAVDHEILIVDDASTDGLADKVAALGFPTVSYFRMETNRGPSAARNFAIGAARGDWIALLDSDDVWLPGKLARQLEHTRAQGVAACSTWYVNDFADSGRRVECRPVPPTRSVDILLHGNQYGLGSTLLARREIFAQVGPFSEDLRRMEDAEWLARYLRSHEFGVVPETLALVSAVPVHLNRCGGQVFLDCAAAFHRHLAPEFRQLTPSFRRRYEAAEFDWAAQAFLREGKWRDGFACMARSLMRTPLRSPGILLSYCDALFGSNLASRAASLRARLARRRAGADTAGGGSAGRA